MNVILLDKVANLGTLGDQVSVKSGYARNFLFPQGKAIPANKANVERFEQRRAELEAELQATLAAAEAKAEKLTALATVTLTAKAGEEGRLFGSIGTRDIAAALTEAGVDVEKSEVRLPHGTLREVGQYELEIQVHADISANITVVIQAAQ